MSVNKPVVSREVATALESALNHFGKAELLRQQANAGRPFPWSGEWAPLNQIDVLTLATALIVGYETEMTPEEKVREYYNELTYYGRTCGIAGGQPEFYRTRRLEVRKTLDLLGIKIEGVNANE